MKLRYLNTPDDSWVGRRFIQGEESPQRKVSLRQRQETEKTCMSSRGQWGDKKREGLWTDAKLVLFGLIYSNMFIHICIYTICIEFLYIHENYSAANYRRFILLGIWENICSTYI